LARMLPGWDQLTPHLLELADPLAVLADVRLDEVAVHELVEVEEVAPDRTDVDVDRDHQLENDLLRAQDLAVRALEVALLEAQARRAEEADRALVHHH